MLHDLCIVHNNYGDKAAESHIQPSMLLAYLMGLCSTKHFFWLHLWSEGPAQVFLLVLTWLITAFGHLSWAQWKNIMLVYDNSVI